MFHRFNLKRTDWDILTVNKILASPTQFSTTAQQYDGTGIPWLNNWKEQGTFSDAATRAKQIAANLIDYSDIDSSATTDSEDNPTYAGLEKCPYINEIRIYFDARVLSVLDEIDGLPETDSMRYVYQSYVNLKNIDLELVNIYNESFSDVKAEIKEISGSYKWSFDGNKEGIPINPVYTETFSNNDLSADSKICMLDIADKNYAYNSFGNLSYPKSENSEIRISSVWSEDKPDTDYTDKEDLPSEHRRIYDFQINDLKIKLTNSTDGSLYDFVYLNSNLLEIRTDVDDGTPALSYLDYQIGDPRQNLLESDWADSDFSTSSNGTLDSVNIVDTSSATDSDIELSNDPTTFSTAYIRNAPIESPWELGAIHRGAAWQTLNLKRHNNDDNAGLGGGDSYSKGDANILDQIKMTSETYIPGKLNLNDQSMPVLKALLYGIVHESDTYESIQPNSGYSLSFLEDEADTISLTEAETLATAFFPEFKGSNFKTRSEILSNNNIVNELTVSLGQTTDAGQEGIIGKIINIVDVTDSPIETIRVIIVTQSIQDIGGINGSTTGTYNQETDKITATQKALIIIQKNPITNKFRIIKFEYLNN